MFKITLNLDIDSKKVSSFLKNIISDLQIETSENLEVATQCKEPSLDEEPDTFGFTTADMKDEEDSFSVQSEVVGKEVDAEGIAWNPQLHSAGKTKTADGCWRKIRVVKKAEEIKTDETLDNVPPPPVTIAPPINVSTVQLSFDQFLGEIMKLIASKKITQGEVNGICKNVFKKDTLMEFQESEDLRKQLLIELNK